MLEPPLKPSSYNRSERPSLTDHEVIEGYLRGDARATETVSRWIRSVVFHSAWRDLEHAEDIVSDTTLKLIRVFRYGKFRGESSLKVYVCRIARYTVVDAIRREVASRDRLKEYEPPSSYYKDPAEVLEETEEASVYQRIWGLMDEKCQRLWRKIFNEQLTYKAIAVQEDVAEATIKTWVFRCKEEAVRMKNQICAKPSRA